MPSRFFSSSPYNASKYRVPAGEIPSWGAIDHLATAASTFDGVDSNW